MKSVIDGDEKGICFLCGRYTVTECHHIFGGSNRKHSERYGLKVYLCLKCHRGGKNGVHENKELMDKLHRIGQERFERDHTREEFRKIFGKNYLDDPEGEKGQKR